MEHVSSVAYFVKGIIKYGFAGGLDFPVAFTDTGGQLWANPFDLPAF